MKPTGVVRGIEVVETDGEASPVSLAGILDLIEPWGRSLYWRVIDLDVNGWRHGVLDVEDIVNRSSEDDLGVQLRWHELVDLGRQVGQLVEGVFLGDSVASIVPVRQPYESTYKEHAVTVDVLDGGIWRVVSSIEALVDDVEASIEKTRRIPPWTRPDPPPTD